MDAPSSAIEYAIDAIRKSKYDDSIKGDTVSVMFNVTPGNTHHYKFSIQYNVQFTNTVALFTLIDIVHKITCF